jgi:hypothetical protein
MLPGCDFNRGDFNVAVPTKNVILDEPEQPAMSLNLTGYGFAGTA